ncbi:MAG TPA: CHAT domain-containing tetratricopeptide repeat protein [Chryseosolibacter sp.]
MISDKFLRIQIKSALRLAVGLVLFFLTISPPASGQKQLLTEINSLIAKAETVRLQKPDAADSLYDAAAKMITELGIESYPSVWIGLLHQRAWSAVLNNKITSARRYLNDSYSFIGKHKEALQSKSDSVLMQTRLVEANYYSIIGNYSGALVNLDNAQDYWIKQKESQPTCLSLYQIIQLKASLYYLQGEFESCIDSYLASIPHFDCYWANRSYPNYVLLYRNIGQAYAKMGDRQNARTFLLRAKTNLDSCLTLSVDPTIPTHALVLYHSLGDFYQTQGKIDSAKYFFNEAAPFAASNVIFAARINEGLAKIALAEKKHATALSFFTKSLRQIIQSRGEKHHLTAKTYRAIASFYQEHHDYDQSLIFIQKSLNSLSPSRDVDVTDFTQNPTTSLISIPKEMVMTLNHKAGILNSYYHRKRDIKLIMAARSANHMALQLLDSTRNEFSLEKDKVVLGEDAVKVYQTGLHIATELYRETNDQRYLAECFELMDKSKSAVLMDHIKLVKSFGGIPSELIDRERELKVELSAAEQQLYTAESKKEETSTHRQHLGDIKRAYAALLNDIKVSAPNYYKLRIENKQLTLSEAQGMLQPGELLVEYFFSDSTLYTMAVTPTTAELHATAIDSLRSQVETLRNMLARPGNLMDPTYHTKWNSICTAVFRKVVAPWKKHLKSSKRIIVVPHDVLNYLPLEMLSDSGSPLVSLVSISYASSAALLREQKQMTPTGNFFAAFNADYSNQPHLPQLAGAAREVSSIENIFGFRSTRFGAATADDFRKQAANFKIIHLALHSLINDEKPMFSRLVFTRTGDDNTHADITANELYSMQLNAEIAVLSACETGLGKLQRGEGMMSLSRAFMYAGVPSTVISLWKVPDQSASILMTKFYQFLKEGHLKDEALQLAKLQFIKEHPEMSQPFFWAGFIVNGKTDPLSFNYFSPREILALAVLGICLLLASSVFIVKRRRSAKPISLTH